MKKLLVIGLFIFIILFSCFNATCQALDLNELNEIIQAEQNNIEKQNQALKEYEDFLNSQTNNKTTNSGTSSNSSSNSSKLPQTGLSTSGYVVGTIITAALLFTVFKLVKYRDI